ncbi:MAG TPA: carboxypeptidase-like regulatory domain-containing protein, partial [Vicinamibacterales bacterium]|nr:carboxypeptidase-like regulatory domain-containing protein [Vicinamibacterales bacterium]
MIWAMLLLAAQLGSGALTGTVRDRAGAVVPGATVTVTDSARGTSRVVAATRAGVYTVSSLPPSTYEVRVELTGFRPAVRQGIRLGTGATVAVDVTLELGAIAEAITVTGDAPALRIATAGLGEIVTTEKITGLPLNGRTFVTLAALAPGVALPPASQLPRINGGRPRTNEYLFDGISVLQPEPGQVAFFPVIDAIQEFKIESNSPPAEFGRFNGGVVNLTTKSGSNQVHGDGFEFWRNQALNARNYFSSTVPDKALFRRNQYGGTLGGPLLQNRTFFFVDYQGQRQTIGRTVISTVPTVLQRQGIFTEAIAGRVPQIFDPATGASNRSAFANNTIPAARMDPIAVALLQRYPLPTAAGTANNYRRTDNEVDNQDQFDIRVDHRFGARDQAFARVSYFRDGFVPVTPLPDGSGVTTGTLGPQETTAWSTATNYQHTFSDRWLNELRVGDTRRAVDRTAAQLATTAGVALNIPGIPTTAQFPNTLPTLQISGYQQLGSPANAASDFSTSVTEIADSLSWLKGRHSIKMGADLRWERLNVIQPPSPTGLFTFTNLFSDQPGVANTG